MELHQLASPFYDFTPNGQNGSLVTKEMLKQKVIQYARSSGKLMYLNLCGDHGLNGENETLLTTADWMKTSSSRRIYEGLYAYVNPINQWDLSYIMPKSEIQRFSAPQRCFRFR